jgi:nitrogenase-associated protein
MSTVTFYEKPGCKGNLRQKTLLAAAGHTVIAKNLKTEAWTADRLLAFLGQLPVGEWFNCAAPAIKSGEIVPENLGAETALRLLLDDPLLIRRPLLEVEKGSATERRVGFDVAAVDAWIGLHDVELPAGNIEACVHGPEGHGRCGSHAHEGTESADNANAANATDAKEGSHECGGAHR